MYTTDKISSKEAQDMIRHVIFEAEKINKPVAVAICGPEGELLAFLRMDGASPAASLIAQNKAYTAARDRKSTREMGEFMTTHHRPQAYWGDPSITGFGGGVPVTQQNKVIGGVGVSGLSEEEDERIATAAIRNAYRK
jgi:glc operon protein GlcG